MRLLLCGDTRIECATPRTRLTMPSCSRLTGGSARTVGTLSCTSPPPCGFGAGLRLTAALKAAAQHCKLALDPFLRSRRLDQNSSFLVVISERLAVQLQIHSPWVGLPCA